MAQAVTKVPTAHNQNLPTGAPALIAGLSIPMLNGAGWIRLSYSGTINQVYAGTTTITFTPKLDGEGIPDGEANVSGPQNAMIQFSRSILLKPGAGQHTYELHAIAANAGPNLWIGNTNLSIEEVGY